MPSNTPPQSRGGRGRFQGGRGNGRGGRRGSGRSNQYAGRSTSNPQSQKEIKFSTHVQGKPQGATYATVKESILQHIQKTYKGGNDIARSLKDLKLIKLNDEKPKREISKESIAAEAAIEQAGMDITYQEELRRFLDRQDNLRENLYKAYAPIYTNYCTRAIQSRVEAHPDFDDKIENNPIVGEKL